LAFGKVDVNLAVDPGEMVALVGPTGAGKSTLVSLITRFYDCQSGDILIDGIDIRKLDLNYLRSQISMVLQSEYYRTWSVKVSM
jgi:ABC-type multidrug transport system fused ATPase/permease subunit